MFCDYCGAQLPEDAPFCTACGAPMKKTQPESNGGQISLQTVMTNKKQLGLLAWGVTILVALVMVISYFVAVNTTFEDTPVVSLLLGDSEREDFRETRLEMKDRVNEIRDMMDDVEDFSSKDEKIIEEALERVEKMGENASLTNMKSVVEYASELDKVDADEDNDVVIYMMRSAISDAGSEVEDLFSGLMTVIFVAMLFALAFSAIGGYLRVKGLIVAGAILSALYGLIFCGILMTIFIVLFNAALIILTDKYKKLA